MRFWVRVLRFRLHGLFMVQGLGSAYETVCCVSVCIFTVRDTVSVNVSVNIRVSVMIRIRVRVSAQLGLRVRVSQH